MNDDLISREALKEALKEAHINRELTFDISTFGCVMSIIDNAPTVESPLTELCDEYCKKCPIEDENECTDCLIPKIRVFIGRVVQK